MATSAFTECYLVHLLAGFARGERLPGREPGFDETPLAILYARALQASRFERAVLLRATADTALFVSGFFAESLPGGDGDIRYYASLGGRAYTRLALEHRHRGPGGRLRLRRAGRALPAVRGRARGDRREDAAADARLRGPALRAMGGNGQPSRRRSPGGAGHHAGRPVRERAPLSAPPDSARDRLGQVAVQVQRRLEAFYALDPEAPVTEYLVAPGEVAHLPGGGSRMLVAQEGDEVSVGVVLDETIGTHLEKSDPRERLDSSNLGAFSTLTEEVSHFLYLLFRARNRRQVTQLELELQAEVDKYLTALFFLGLQNEGAVSTRLRQLLFSRYRLAEGLSAESAERYHEASRLANRYCGWLEAQYLRSRRLPDLASDARRFWRLGQREKLETIAALH